MSVKEESSLVITPDGTCELRVDRVMLEGNPLRETRRLKASRRQTGAAHVFDHSHTNQILPAGCRFVLPFQSGHFFVIEQPPQVRLVSWKYKLSGTWEWLKNTGRVRKYGLTPADASRETFTLAFPYVVFCLFMGKDGIGIFNGFYRTEPLRTLDDPLMYMGITNYFDDGHICMGTDAPVKHRIWAEGAERMVAYFWQSGFNTDQAHIYARYADRIPEMRTIWDWEYWSQRHPSWPLEAKWDFSGKTPRHFLHALPSDSSQLFRTLVAKASSSPEWRDGGPLVIQAGYVPSASLSAIVGSRVLRQGDILMATEDKEGFCKGKTYRIEYFFELDNSHRRAKLEGIDGPVCLHCLMGDGKKGALVLSQQGKEESDFFIADGIPLVPGIYFQVSSSEDIPGFRRGDRYRIVEMRKDADGDVCVRVDEGGAWIYLTSQGKLFPSICFVIPILEGNTFRYEEARLTVGEVVKLTRSAVTELPSDVVVRVSAIAREASGAFMVEFEGIPGRHILMSATQELHMNWKAWPYEVSERKIVFGEHTLDLTFGTHLLPTKPESGLCVGHLYRVLAAVPSTAPKHHPMDIDLVLQYGNAPIPLIRQSQWVLNPNTFLVATDTFTHDGMTLRRGFTLRHIGSATEFFAKDQDFRIVGFVPSQLSGFTEVVFGNGAGMTLCAEFLKQQFQWLDQGEWKPVLAPTLAGSNISMAQLRQGYLETGGHAILTNGEGLRDNQKYVGHVCLIKGTVDRYDRGVYLSKVIFLSDPEQRLREISQDRLAGLKNVIERRHFKAPHRVRVRGVAGDLNHPQALAMYRAGPAQGRLEAGEDCQGRDIHIGDIVRPKQIDSGLNQGNALARSGIGKQFLVVGRGRYNGCRDYFLYLLVGEHRSEYGIDNRTYGFNELPSDLRSREILRDIALCLSADCELMSFVAEKSVFQTGRLVKVKDGITPHYGWGKVKEGEHGQVMACCDGEVQVQFAHEPEWIGKEEELEFVPVPGASVRLYHPQPRYGCNRVTMEAVGVLREPVSEESDLFLVDFPGHPGFYAYLDELEIL